MPAPLLLVIASALVLATSIPLPVLASFVSVPIPASAFVLALSVPVSASPSAFVLASPVSVPAPASALVLASSVPVPALADPIAFVGTFLLGWLFFSFTAQVAASFFIAGPPWRRALVVGVVPAIVSMALIRFHPIVIVAVGLAADAVAIHRVYQVGYRTTSLVVLLHYAATIAIVLVLANLVALLSTAPG